MAKNEAESTAIDATEAQVRYLNLPRLETGTVVNGRYRVEALLGKGGFGMVFSGFDLTLKTEVALKFFDPASLRDEKKFLRVQREINLARRISDPRIVRIYSLETWSGIWFMVMELVNGATLRDMLKARGRFAWEEFRPVFAEILGGMGSLHALGIIHRDLKPSNIMVDDQGRVKILDFGLAKEIGDQEKTSSIGEIVGSPFYLSPEQIQGLELGVESDIYQLGILLYQALTGAFPFADTTTMGLVLKHLNQKPDPVAAQGVKVPGVVEFVVAKALAKRRQDRFRSTAEMAGRLRKDKAPLPSSLARRIPGAFRLAMVAAAALALAYAIYMQTFGSGKIAAVQSRGTTITAHNRFGRTIWRRDFAPFRVHLALLAKGHDPAISPDQQNPIRFVNESFLSRLPYLGSPLVMVFLSHPGKGVFPADASIASTGQDNQLAVLDARGRLLGRDSYARLFGLRSYDFSPVFTMSNFHRAGGDHADGRLALFHMQNFQGMYPSAQVALKGTTFAVLCTPGSVVDARVLEDGPGGARLLVLGANNLVSHLGYLTESRLVPGVCTTRGVPPNYFNDLELEPGAFLTFLPRRCRIIKEEWLARGRVRLLDEQERETITVHRDGLLEVEREGRVAAYRDDPATLERAYSLVNRYFQQRVAHRNPEKALELADAAAALAVRNPYLRSAILYLKGDCEVRLGRFAPGRRALEEALRLFPWNNDALAKLLETTFLEKGPLAAVALLEGPYSQIENIFGLGIGGLLMKGECHLAAGQMEKARECFERIYQENFPDSREALLAQLHLFAGRYDQALALLRQAEGKVPGFFDIREYRLLLARSMVLAGAEPARCRWILEDLAKFSLRQGHMAEVSLCYLLAGEGKGAEARERIVPAFAKLRQFAAGDFETRIWLWYDAYVYARAMELLGDRREARAGYRACLEANPHTALAAEARRALSRP